MKKEPTKKELIAALKSFDKAAHAVHKNLFLIQPFLSIYVNHAKVMNWISYEHPKKNVS